jgi:hypothetical protein
MTPPGDFRAYLARTSGLPGRELVEPRQVFSSLVGELWHQETYTKTGASGTGALRGLDA